MHPDLTLTEQAEAVRHGALSPVVLVQRCLERIEHLDRRLNAFITVTAEAALDEARRAEAECSSGVLRGPLHGVPVAVKDIFETAGVRTTLGSKFFSSTIPASDAVVVQRLKAAGAIVVGKLNLHEIALGVLSDNPHFGRTCNPWDAARSPGGSSGGAGAALAAGMVPGALGSDTRGSIRIPAALCGVVGLKPTFGRVSLRGTFPLSWSLDHAGPMARTVRDTALLYHVISGYDRDDPLSADLPLHDPLPGLDQGVRGWRVLLAADAFFTDADPAITAAVNDAAQTLARLGARVETVNLSDLRDTLVSSRLIVSTDAAACHAERLNERPDDFGADVLARLRIGQNTTGVEYALARAAQTRTRHRISRLFDACDLVLTPTTRMTAPRFDDPAAVEAARASLSYFTAPFNLSGHPALSLPCGFTADGLPIGLQMVAAHGQEAALLRGAYAFEQATDFHRRRSDLE